MENVFLLLDLAGLANIYELLQEWFKPNTRGLRDWEKQLAKAIFGESIQYQRVRIDEYALVGPRQYRFCYVLNQNQTTGLQLVPSQRWQAGGALEVVYGGIIFR